ncbi:MAG: selenocysteine-specific translation elongation factor [Nitrosomonadales bacterium]|nr:selenocysteine-specific translation elongation factor [Nitrosomonadales bacterium]
MIVGTAGHIDHGKTTLVKALTGVDTDRLKEEQERGITLDLGYAYTPLRNGEVLGFIDVPGHEKLVHNMLAGATGIDFVLLVVAADDGPMPQTREHLAILNLLGLSRGAVALTKVDRVPEERVAQVHSEITSLLMGTPLEGSPIFPLSAVNGAGVDALRGYLDEAALAMPPHAATGNFRLAVDRCFTLSGTGTVVTGTVFSGTVQVGDQLLLSPANIQVRVRGIHAQNRQSETGMTGQRCALNLAGTDFSKDYVRRGDWILAEHAHGPTQRLDVRLHLLAGADKPLRHWSPLHFHLGAVDVMARVVLLEHDVLEPGASGLAQVVLDRPIGALHGDRFIIRDQSASRTLGGGRVLDPFPPERKRRTAERLALLAALEQPAARAVLQGMLEATPNGIDLHRFTLCCNLTPDEFAALRREVMLAEVESTAFPIQAWEALQQAVLAQLAEVHRLSPEILGPDVGRLRRLAAPRLSRAVFANLLGRLRDEGRIAQKGPWWHLPEHRITLSSRDQLIWDKVKPLLQDQPFQPPRVRDLANTFKVEEDRMRSLMQQLAAMGEIYRVAHDHYFIAPAVEQLAEIVRGIAAEHGSVTAASFRDRIGTGRKLAIQILEFFDASAVTRRAGDAHYLR